MKTMMATLLVALASGCATTHTWQDIAHDHPHTAKCVENQFLEAAWNAYLAAHHDEPKADHEYRRSATATHRMLQCGHLAAVQAYVLSKQQSEADLTRSRIFLDVTRVADSMEKDFLKTFGKKTSMHRYPRTPNNEIQPTQ